MIEGNRMDQMAYRTEVLQRSVAAIVLLVIILALSSCQSSEEPAVQQVGPVGTGTTAPDRSTASGLQPTVKPNATVAVACGTPLCVKTRTHRNQTTDVVLFRHCQRKMLRLWDRPAAYLTVVRKSGVSKLRLPVRLRFA